MEKISRRDFLRGSAAGAVTMALTGMMPFASFGSSIAFAEESGVYPEINIGIGGDPEKLSPFQANKYGQQIRNQLYETLFYMVSEDGDMVLYPSVGKTYEMTDDTHCVVEIFDYVKDSNGNLITAADVAYCCNLARDYAENNVTVLAEATAVDDYTVEFEFTRALALGEKENFLRYVCIFSQAEYEASGNEFATAPVTTGAYKATNFTPGYSVTLEINENYWQTDDTYRQKYSAQNVQKINYYVISESTQMSMALQSGTIDLSTTVNYADLDNFLDGGSYAADFDVDYILDNLFVLIEPNCSSSSVCNDVLVRKAVFYAIDNSAMALAVSGGNAEVCYTLGNTKASDYNYDWQSEEGTIYSYDPDYAKELLAEAGYADGLTLRLLTRSDELYQTVSTILQAYLSMAGINLTIELSEQSIVDNEKQDETYWDLYMTTYTNNDYMSKGWGFVFDPERYTTGLTENFIDDEVLQEKLNAVRSVETHSAETVNDMNAYVNENAYAYGVVSEKAAEVYTSDITEVVWDPVGQFVLPGACVYVTD